MSSICGTVIAMTLLSGIITQGVSAGNDRVLSLAAWTYRMRIVSALVLYESNCIQNSLLSTISAILT